MFNLQVIYFGGELDAALCLHPTNNAFYISFFNDYYVDVDSSKNETVSTAVSFANTSSMDLEIEFSNIWNDEYKYWYYCQKSDITIEPHSYKVVVFSLSLNSYYSETFTQFDTFVVNIGDSATLICIVISFCLTSLFLIIGLKLHSSNDTDLYSKISYIYTTIIIICCWQVVTFAAAYFHKIFDIGQGCSTYIVFTFVTQLCFSL